MESTSETKKLEWAVKHPEWVVKHGTFLAQFLTREEVEAMIMIGVLTEKALKYCKGN